MRMRPWLEKQINSNTIPGLKWLNKVSVSVVCVCTCMQKTKFLLNACSLKVKVSSMFIILYLSIINMKQPEMRVRNQ